MESQIAIVPILPQPFSVLFQPFLSGLGITARFVDAILVGLLPLALVSAALGGFLVPTFSHSLAFSTGPSTRNENQIATAQGMAALTVRLPSVGGGSAHHATTSVVRTPVLANALGSQMVWAHTGAIPARMVNVVPLGNTAVDEKIREPMGGNVLSLVEGLAIAFIEAPGPKPTGRGFANPIPEPVEFHTVQTTTVKGA